jgi:hypothetical protein
LCEKLPNSWNDEAGRRNEEAIQRQSLAILDPGAVGVPGHHSIILIHWR